MIFNNRSPRLISKHWFRLVDSYERPRGARVGLPTAAYARLEVTMRILSPFIKSALQASAIAAVLTTGLVGCGGGDNGTGGGSAVAHVSGSAAAVAAPYVIPPDAKFRGKTYAEWEALSWQWALALPKAGHPFLSCSAGRRISDDQTGNVWFWAAPTATVKCDQRSTIIPANTAIFLTTLDAEASSLEAPPFGATKYEDQLRIARQFADYIQDLFVIIDGQQVPSVTAYRFATAQFIFTAPTPWIFGDTGGMGTSVGDGYFYMLHLPPGPHTIEYGGTFNYPPPDGPVKMDVTLLVTVGG